MGFRLILAGGDQWPEHLQRCSVVVCCTPPQNKTTAAAMQKETFRLKHILDPLPSQLRGLSNRGPARCPYDDADAEQDLIRDILLTASAIMMTSTGALATAASVYTLIVRLDVFLLCDERTLLVASTVLIVAAVLVLVCALVSLCGVLHKRDPEVNIPTLALMSGLTTLLAAASGIMATTSRAKIPLTAATTTTTVVRLLDSIYRTELLSILTTSLGRYGMEPMTQSAWDAVQTRLGCCGVNDRSDWLKTLGVVPESCCSSTSCPGCVDPVAIDLATVASSTAATSFILVVVTFVSSFIFGWLWATRGRKTPPPAAVVYSVEMLHRRPSLEQAECWSMGASPSNDSTLSVDSTEEEELHVRYFNLAHKS